MITLIGVGHVFDISRNLEHAILKRSPQAVCVELDMARYQALVSREKDGDAPIMYKFLSAFQERIAKKYGTEVGSEMITAIETARVINARLFFIDMDASRLVSKFWKSMSFKERVKFGIAMFGGMFVRKKRIEKELERFEEKEEQYMEGFQQEFPTVKRVLLDDRNKHMAEAIRKISEQHENIVVVVGDGHVEGIRSLLETTDVEIIRLSQLRSEEDGKADEEVDEVTISYELSYDENY